MGSDAADLQRALEKDEFYPVFQPQVELRTGQITGFELLARWRTETSAAVSPEQFIPRIEAAQLSDRLTESMLDQALSAPALQGSSCRLSVNLSPVQVQNPQLPTLIAACAQRTRFPMDRLTLEITESALLRDIDSANAVARELKSLGCRLALDDFGTGYSSLGHLEALPFDELKVDGRFVGSMTEARESRKIVAAVVGLGQSLGLATVAEGVETAAQSGMLLWFGCDLGQGWLYGRPAPADQIAHMLSAPSRNDSPTPPVSGDAAHIMGLDALPAQRLAQIQAIYDGVPVGLCFLDRRLRYVSINRRLAEMNGAPVAAHLGKPVAEVMPHLFPIIEPYIRRALTGEPVVGVEVRKPASPAGDEPRTLLISYQPARDEAGEIIGVSVAVTDVTEHQRTEEALRESVSHFRHLLELGPHVPWVLNAEGEVVEASPRWESVTGQPLSQAKGHGWLKMLHPDDRASAVKAVRSALADGRSIDTTYRVHRPDGSWLSMRSRGAPRLDAEGHIVAIYGVLEEAAEQPERREALRLRSTG